MPSPTKSKLKVLAIVGPTASGKSAWAVELAKKFNGVVLSADSRQVYKKLNELTAKIPKAEMKRVPHYLIDVVDIGESFSVAEYQKMAYKLLFDIRKQNQNAKKPILPIVAGGTGLYISAVCNGYEFEPIKPDYELRAKLERMSLSQLQKKLLKLDPTSGVDLKNPRRVMRAIEIRLNGGGLKPNKKAPFDVLRIGINKTPVQIKAAIRKRINRLDTKKLISEIGLINKHGRPLGMGSLSLYYAPVQAYLDKEISLAEMRAAMVFADTHYSKRQMTWFRKDRDVHWVASLAAAEKLVDKWLNS